MAAKKTSAKTAKVEEPIEEVFEEAEPIEEVQEWRWVNPPAVTADRLWVLLRRRGVITGSTQLFSADFYQGLQHVVRTIRRDLEITGEADQQTSHAIKTMNQPSAAENEILTDGDWAALLKVLER